MQVLETIDEVRFLRRTVSGTIALVPTLGALHDGHMSLIAHGRRLADRIWVSIFVNPTQFGPDEDFDCYPRSLNQDLRLCEEAGVTAVFAPSVPQIYPPHGIETIVDVPAISTDLEGDLRPGHFRGVCRVVAKIFNIIQPDIACFGQKDYQQLLVIKALVHDLAMPVKIVASPTIRERDGLAMSSRNQYLNANQRYQASALFKALTEAKRLVIQEGQRNPIQIEQAMAQILREHQIKVDYAVLRHGKTLAKLVHVDPNQIKGVVALIAGRIGKVHLIDNMIIKSNL